MKELEIKLTGQQNLGEITINIDDKPVQFKKNNFGNLVCKYQTENDKVNIKIARMLDVGGVLWFITQLLFFVISIFGILDIHHKQKCFVIDFEADVELKEESKILLQLNTPREDDKAISIETDLSVQEITNKVFVDKKAKKTLKILTISKIILALAIIGAIIAVLMVKI